jgi:hypothetical protein
MIYIIGTDHFFQVPTVPRRAVAGRDGMIQFHRYLSSVATRLGADMLTEEASAEWVGDQGLKPGPRHSGFQPLP